MKLHQALISTVAAIALTAGASVAVSAADVNLASLRPTFPEAKAEAAKAADVVPAGAQFKMQSGKSGVRYVACNEQRTWTGGHIELHCLTFSTTKGWGKSLRWIPRYQLAKVDAPLPEVPAAVALR